MCAARGKRQFYVIARASGLLIGALGTRRPLDTRHSASCKQAMPSMATLIGMINR
jgi:hypothetical protein